MQRRVVAHLLTVKSVEQPGHCMGVERFLISTNKYPGASHPRWEAMTLSSKSMACHKTVVHMCATYQAEGYRTRCCHCREESIRYSSDSGRRKSCHISIAHRAPCIFFHLIATD